MIVEKIVETKSQKIRQAPVNSNRASEIGFPCDRYHVLNRTRWQERALHSVRLQQVFELGSAIEDLVMRDLAEAGIKVIEQQRAFSWPEYQITGHVDGRILIDGRAYPLEIKSASPYIFTRLDSVDDMRAGKYAYLLRYPAQLTLYLLMSNEEKGLFLFKNKVSGELKEVWMDLDYAYGEELLQRCERVNAHIAAGTLPDRIPYNEMLCGECAYRHICLPEVDREGVEIADDPTLAEALDRLESLKQYVKEAEEIEEIIRKKTEGRENIVAGGWLITGAWYERTVYDIPVEVKKQYAVKQRYWRRKITRL